MQWDPSSRGSTSHICSLEHPVGCIDSSKVKSRYLSGRSYGCEVGMAELPKGRRSLTIFTEQNQGDRTLYPKGVQIYSQPSTVHNSIKYIVYSSARDSSGPAVVDTNEQHESLYASQVVQDVLLQDGGKFPSHPQCQGFAKIHYLRRTPIHSSPKLCG